ncbi:VOC family protein [Nocardia harenae]|uniref:VOC family protein n=1 Tax=Nocardia harenae TaxID=358707 RepID=UPI0008352F7C|nr:VOC family protein [Nocardia harenae]
MPMPGPIRQIGYVVADIDERMRSWVELGVGPWFVLRGVEQRGVYRGAPCAVTLSIAFAQSGELQVELIQQENDAPSIYAGHTGFHQLAWWAEDYEAAVRAAGRPVLWSGDAGTRYAFFDGAGGPAPYLELSEYTERTAGLAGLVRGAAERWNGADPVRSL